MHPFPKTTYLLLLFIVLLSCQDKEEVTLVCESFQVHNSWPAEEFKETLDIQFPATYEGRGRFVHFEGETFEKNRDGGIVSFTANFCRPTFCDSVGEVKPTGPITGQDKQGQMVVLPEQLDLCLGSDLIAEFHYNTGAERVGKLYYTVEGDLRESVLVQFPDADFDEVVEILKTIVEN